MLKRIGVGAYGEVWMARSVTGALRAVKIVFRERFDHDRTYEREFAGLKKFEPVSRSHPGLVDILHVGRNDADGYFFCVMELADNAEFAPELGSYTPLTLAEHVRRENRLTVAECAQIGAAVAGALAHLHDQHLIHRDVKPSNIIFVNGQPKLADIGLLAAMGEARSFVGTDGFIPPEGPGSARADIYGLGKTLYEMATGRSRLDFPDLPPEFEAALEGPAFLELNEIILRACADSAEQRHGSGEELRGELLLVDAGRSIRKMRRNERLLRIWWRIGFAACLAIVVAGGGFWWERIRAEAANREAQASAYQRRLIEKKELAARQNLYAADMNLTQQAIEGGNYGRAAALLDLYVPKNGEPDLRGFEWHYYSHILRGDSVDVIRGHSHVVSSLALNPAGTRFYSASFDNTIRAWSLESRKELRRWTMPGCLFASISLDASERRIVGECGELHFGATVDIESSRWVTNTSSRNSSVAFTPDGQGIARGVSSSIFSTNGTVEIVDLDYKQKTKFPESGGRVYFSTNKKLMVTGPWGGSLKLWSWPELAPVGVLEGAGVVMSVSFSPDSSKLASVSQQGQICIWDVESKRLLASSRGHNNTVIWSVAFSPDGKRIATTGTDQTVRTWDAENLEERHVYRGHGSEVWAAIWSPDGRQIISGSKDSTIRVWNGNPAPPIRRISNVSRRPIFAANSQMVAARLRDGSAAVLRMGDQQEILRIQDVEEIGGFQNADSDLVVLTKGGEVQKRRVEDGKVSETWRVEGLLAKPFRKILSPSGGWLVYGGADGELAMIETKSREGLRRLKSHGDTVLSLAFSPDERLLVTASVDNTARLWELSSGKLLRQFGNQRMGVGSVVFSSDGGTIATGVWDDTLHVWDLNSDSDRERMILSGHEGGVQTVVFSPDKRTIFALSGTGVLKFWSVAAQREAGQMRLSPGPRAGWLSISPNGEWLAVVDQNESMTLLPAPHENPRSAR